MDERIGAGIVDEPTNVEDFALIDLYYQSLQCVQSCARHREDARAAGDMKLVSVLDDLHRALSASAARARAALTARVSAGPFGHAA